jgi:hypothetical protein
MKNKFTVEHYVNGCLYNILKKKEYQHTPPCMTFELQRLKELNDMFFVSRSDVEWVEDKKGQFRRLEIDVLSKRKIYKWYYAPTPSKTCEELYEEILLNYKSSTPSPTFMDWHKYAPWSYLYHTDEKGFLFNKTISLYEPYYRGTWVIGSTEEPLDFTKIHPNYKKALLELIDYTLSLDEPFKSYLDTLNGQILPDHAIERRLKTVDQLRQIKSILSN